MASEKREQVAKKSSPISSIAERYATALFELAEDDKALNELENDVGRFATLHDGYGRAQPTGRLSHGKTGRSGADDA